MANIKMGKDVHTILRKKIIRFKQENGLTWKLIQSISLKAVYGTPCEWQTLHKIANYKNVHPNTIKKVLDFFEIPCVQEHLIVTLLKPVEQ